MSTAVPKLILSPADPASAPGRAAMEAALAPLQLLGAAFSLAGRRHYLPGPQFLDHLIFLGCAPQIELLPSAPEHLLSEAGQGRFCHLGWHSSPAPRLRVDRRLRRLSCPACGAALPVGSALFTALASGHGRCAQCQVRLDPANLAWRRHAAWARVFFEVWGIHEAEAVVSPTLQQSLEQLTGGPWRLSYLGQELQPA